MPWRHCCESIWGKWALGRLWTCAHGPINSQGNQMLTEVGCRTQSIVGPASPCLSCPISKMEPIQHLLHSGTMGLNSRVGDPPLDASCLLESPINPGYHEQGPCLRYPGCWGEGQGIHLVHLGIRSACPRLLPGSSRAAISLLLQICTVKCFLCSGWLVRAAGGQGPCLPSEATWKTSCKTRQNVVVFPCGAGRHIRGRA